MQNNEIFRNQIESDKNSLLEALQALVEQPVKGEQRKDIESWIANYLSRNPAFFVDRESLLENLSLTHPETGEAVSLVHRQLSVLRDKKTDFENKVNLYLDHANLNTQIFSKIQQFTADLMRAKSDQEAVDIIYRQMQLLFSVDETSIHSFVLPYKSVDGIKQLGMSQRWAQALASTVRPNRPLCGQVDAEWRNGLFYQHKNVASMCIIPLGEKSVWGLVALGSLDLKFNDDDTLFLKFLGSMITAKLEHLFRQPEVRSSGK